MDRWDVEQPEIVDWKKPVVVVVVAVAVAVEAAIVVALVVGSDLESGVQDDLFPSEGRQSRPHFLGVA